MKKKNKKKVVLKKKNLLLLVALLILFIGIIAGSIIIFSNNKKVTKSKNGKKVDDSVLIEKNENQKEKLQIVDIDSTSRPFAVMINNIGTARPLQSGLQDAYIIYEMVVEGGITRYLALFMDTNTERIGSIRSARHYYLDYALENDAIYVHHGYSPQAQNDFSALGVDRISVDTSKTGWRDKTLNVSSEHTLFSSIEKLNKGTTNLRTKRNKDLLLNYSASSIDMANIPNSKTANNVSIKYSGSTTSSYEYDAENKVYKRSVNGKAHTDYVTKKQYTFKNIITYQVENYALNDGSGKDRQGINNIGSGNGYYISEGYAIPITWEKKSRSEQTIYKYEDGTELKVNDGNTFIQIQPKNKDLTIN